MSGGLSLVVNGSKSNATVQASAVFLYNTFGGANCTLRLILNGNTTTPLATGSAVMSSNSTPATATVQATGVNLANGDLIKLQCQMGSSANMSIKQDANTWVKDF
ncbi:hypothetical protein [Nocardia concava]|uniref:hypothetical protein n=1 Tax=Nocardia concava TaxID=257281 RepID=UPI00031A43CF|nr:hypothetical protein [Nocardia concava]